MTPNRLRDVSAPETSPRRKQPPASPRQNGANPSPRRLSARNVSATEIALGVSATSQRLERLRDGNSPGCLRDRMTPNRLRDAPAVVAASPRRLSAQNVSATDPRRRGASPRQKTGRFSSPRRKLGDFRLRDEKMDDFRLRDEKRPRDNVPGCLRGGGVRQHTKCCQMWIAGILTLQGVLGIFALCVPRTQSFPFVVPQGPQGRPVGMVALLFM